MPLLVWSHYHHLVSTPKILSKEKKTPIWHKYYFKIQYSELPDPTYVHCQQPKAFFFIYRPSTTPASPKRTVWTQCEAQPPNKLVCTFIARDSSCHQSHIAIYTSYLTGSSIVSQCHRYACALETFSNPIKIKLGCRGISGAIWQKTLGSLRIFDSDLPLQLSINTNTFQVATIIGLGCEREKK